MTGDTRVPQETPEPTGVVPVTKSDPVQPVPPSRSEADIDEDDSFGF
jgi:hypothetical protein